MNYPSFILQDLGFSGLKPGEMFIRLLEGPERASSLSSAHAQGYVIPYYNISGKPIPHYRVRLFDEEAKYKQPKNSNNHIYFPPNFKSCPLKNFVIVAEGEKKAFLLCKLGFKAIGLGGVDSWRNRIINLPESTQLVPGRDDSINAKVSDEVVEDLTAAQGFQDLVDYAHDNNLHIVVVFDTDDTQGIKPQVQRAAAVLGFELRFRGIPLPRIRQLILPYIQTRDFKTGVDDFLLQDDGVVKFQTLLTECIQRKSAFPRYPMVKSYIAKRLQTGRMSRRDLQNVSIAVITELDSDGVRLRNLDQTFYFDYKDKKLIKSSFDRQQFEAKFAKFLYHRFGLGGGDAKLLEWLGTIFTAEEPIEEVTPHRVFARSPKDDVTFQLSDSQYCIVDATGLAIYDNGTNNILFESDQVEGIDGAKVKHIFDGFKKDYDGKTIPCWWSDVLSEVRLRDKDRQRKATALLYYVSPWLHRWRGTQLPIELILGESGSGKSTLCQLRLNVQTGKPHLRNAPTDIKDWYASITSTGGLHITDNVQLTDRGLRNTMSNELCRIVTEPEPTVEQRLYYTNAGLIRIPIRCVFGITSIQQPFQNADILQRSMFLEFEKDPNNLTYDSTWEIRQLNRFGGRECWIAHHLYVLHRFFQEVRLLWDPRYIANSRLVNFEQAMMVMARLFGIPYQWVSEHLSTSSDKAISEADWCMEGLLAFSVTSGLNGAKFGCLEISNWALSTEDFDKCEMLTNTRKLGKYIKAHESQVASIAKILPAGTANNRQVFRFAQNKK